MPFRKPRHLTWREFFRRLWVEIEEDAVTECAAQLAFYFLFSLFPFLFFLVTLAAYLPFAPGAVDAMVERLGPLMPADALQLVRGHLESLVSESQPRLITLGLLVALWSASRGVDAFRRALNLAYDVPEYRPYWKTQGLAIVMTVAGSLVIPLAFALFLLGGRVGEWAAEHLHVLNVYHVVWSWLRWPLTACLVMLVLALCYWRLPAVRHRYQFLSPGAVLASVLWLLTTWGFTQYVEHFGRYNVTYGSIGGVVVLLLWLYLTGLIFILGGEVNAVLEHAEAEAAQAAGKPSPIEAPHLVAGVPRERGSGRERLAFWRWRRRMAERASPEVEPPAKVQESPDEGSRREEREEHSSLH
ncbi:YihY/virulence factor BrkB family protein [Archangium minus]|uniref:YihY/virulence factor BrkB family protein n=1 Tax=Archangium minus TaxID=83450 RepID=A0ABY9WPA5_9BACT|nr:YihY/virulence factor BrkB family protein [Archangium minus]